MSYHEITDDTFVPIFCGTWQDYTMVSEFPPDMVHNVLIVNENEHEVMAGVRSKGDNTLNRIVRLAPKGRVEASIRMQVKVYRDTFEYYSSQDDVKFYVVGYWSSWPPTPHGKNAVAVEEEPTDNHFYRDCVLFDEKENFPCQHMVDDECPHDCDDYTDKVMIK